MDAQQRPLHCLHVDRVVDWQEADVSHLRDDLLLLHGLADEDELMARIEKLKTQDA